jgi:hypothetical protein
LALACAVAGSGAAAPAAALAALLVACAAALPVVLLVVLLAEVSGSSSSCATSPEIMNGLQWQQWCTVVMMPIKQNAGLLKQHKFYDGA